MAISLRLYQREAVLGTRVQWRAGSIHTLIALPVATGKTWIFCFMIHAIRANGLRCLVLVNRDELVEQTVQKLARIGIRPGIVKADRNEWSRDVVVASVQTLWSKRRLYIIPPNRFSLVVVDECHYANSPGYQRVLQYFGEAYHLGCTATPFRGDHKSLADAGWQSVAYVYPWHKAVEDGWLAPLRVERLQTTTTLVGVSSKSDAMTGQTDFTASRLSSRINTPTRNDAIVQAWIDRISPRRTLGFCATVEHTVSLANAFRRRGIEAHAIYGEMGPRERRVLIDGHKRGRFLVLINCQVLTHGYDDPGIQAIIMAKPTQSKVLYIQCVGRGLRPDRDHGKQDCVLLDVVDISDEHSMAINAEVAGLLGEFGQDRAIADGAVPELKGPESCEET
ncbi:MAG: DEAD/DEAH box helicase [bacterium]